MEEFTKEQRLLFALNTQEYYRNYIMSGAISKIKKQCIFLIDKSLNPKSIPQVEKKRIYAYSYPKEKNRLHWHLFNINTKRFINISRTFKFRFLRLTPSLQLKYSFLSLFGIYHIVRLLILSLTGDRKLENIIRRIYPSLILIPSSGYEGVTFEIIKIAKKLKIPTCLLIDNWDNLCSKTIFTRKSDYLAVWGKQSAEMAQTIHKFERDKIFIIGTPRFLSYFNRNKLTSPYHFPYALFAGNALAFDELTTLKKLDQLIEKGGPKLKIVYRPHPWRHPRKSPDTFFDYDFKHVILDTNSRTYYKKGLGESFAPPLDYYPKLLSNMEFMICPLSTMLIEGLLFDKRVFVLTYDDGIHFTNPKNAFYYYEHFKGIDKLSNITIIDMFKNLKDVFTKPRKSENNSSKLGYFITEETKNYQENLKKIVWEMTNESQT